MPETNSAVFSGWAKIPSSGTSSCCTRMLASSHSQQKTDTRM